MKSYEPKFKIGDLLVKNTKNFPDGLAINTRVFIVARIEPSVGGFHGRYYILEDGGVESWSWTVVDRLFKLLKE